MARVVLTLILTVLTALGSAAHGFAEDAGDRAALPWATAADDVIRASQDGPEALARALSEVRADPWLVMDVLIGREAWDIASALAEKWRGPRFDGLRVYLAEQRKTPADPRRRDARDRAALALQAGDLPRVLETAQGPSRTDANVPEAALEQFRGMALAAGGRAKEAMEAFVRAADLAERIGWLGHAQGSLNRAGGVALQGGLLEDALRLLLRQEPIAEKAGRPEEHAGCVINVGSVYAQLQQWDDAIRWLRRGLDLTLPSVGGDPVKIRNYRLNDLLALGQLHFHRGEYAHAVGVLEEAPALAASLGRPRERGLVLLFLAHARLPLELIEDAATAYGEAAAAFETVGDGPRHREALRGLAACDVDLRRHDEALETYRRLAALSEAAGDPPGVRAGDRGAHALALQAAGRAEEAEAEYQAALAEAVAARDEDAAAWIRLNRATLLCEQRRYGEARPLLEGAVERAHADDDAYRERHALRWLAEAYLAQGDAIRAMALADRGVERATSLLGGLADVESARARASVADLVEVGLRAAVARDDADAALRYAESGRGIAFLEMLGARPVDALSAIPSDLRGAADQANEAVREARGRYEEARASGDRTASRVAREALDAALEAFQVARRRIERLTKLGADAAYPEPAAPESIRAALRADEALVAYFAAGGRLFAVVVRPGVPGRIAALGESAPIGEALDAFREEQDDPSAAADPGPLRARLVAPLALGKDVRRVAVAPVGPMNEIPFALLLPEHEVTYAPSGTLRARLSQGAATKGTGLLALGNPDYTGAARRTSPAAGRFPSLLPLPATAEEVARVAPAPGDQRLLGAEATEEALRRHLQARPRWRSVHLACHGVLDPERPALSSLAVTPSGLDDGYLTALEVSSLRVSADLVVLSACETARGRVEFTEGVVGLTRAFLLAGAPRVICSLWSVDDEATRALMVKFYELWNPPPGGTRAPLEPAAALKEAQAFVRGQEKWKHPYFWAAWVLWGAP